jgi:hypothetical protein
LLRWNLTLYSPADLASSFRRTDRLERARKLNKLERSRRYSPTLEAENTCVFQVAKPHRYAGLPWLAVRPCCQRRSPGSQQRKRQQHKQKPSPSSFVSLLLVGHRARGLVRHRGSMA